MAGLTSCSTSVSFKFLISEDVISAPFPDSVGSPELVIPDLNQAHWQSNLWQDLPEEEEWQIQSLLRWCVRRLGEINNAQLDKTTRQASSFELKDYILNIQFIRMFLIS
jgi:hypothetical protein